MSHITRIIAVGLLLSALASGVVQALPLALGTHPSKSETSGVLILVMDRLFSLLGLGPSPGDQGQGMAVPHRGSTQGQEKEGLVIDPNGHH